MWSTIGTIALFCVKFFMAWTARKAEKKKNLKEGFEVFNKGRKTGSKQLKLSGMSRIGSACFLFCLILLAGCTKPVHFRLPWTSDPPITVWAIADSHMIDPIPPGAWIEWDDMTDVPSYECDPGDILGEDCPLIDVSGDKFYIEHWGSFMSNHIQEEVQAARVRHYGK